VRIVSIHYELQTLQNTMVWSTLASFGAKTLERLFGGVGSDAMRDPFVLVLDWFTRAITVDGTAATSMLTTSLQFPHDTRFLVADVSNSTVNDAASGKLRGKSSMLMLLGTGLSAAGASVIVVTYCINRQQLKRYRILGHVVFKASHIILMSLGYYLNVLPFFDCSQPAWCAVQFILLQLANVGIIASEAALAIEIFRVMRFLWLDRLSDLKSALTKPARAIQAVYAFYVLAVVLSVIAPLTRFDLSVTCWFETWCWYKSFEQIIAFKFGWIGVIVSFSMGTIITMEWLSRFKLRHTMGQDGLSITRSLIHTARNALLCHCLAWGSTFVWRGCVAFNMTLCESNPMLDTVVLLNLAGAGYLDVWIWLASKEVKKRTCKPLWDWIKSFRNTRTPRSTSGLRGWILRFVRRPNGEAAASELISL